ncbi:desmoplakin-B-like isoform X1 [Clinocottus analis]|uniref:desmoplakin-B-like isoform X1 n=1 Tax=Clinocottus analis TaxID=304258 RepID=UPI0035C166DF
MSMYGSQKGLNMSRTVGSKGDLTGMGTTQYARSEVVHGGGNGYDPYLDGYQTYSFSKSSGGGMASGTARGMGGGMASGMSGGTVTRMMGSMGGGMASGMSGGRMSTGGGRMSTGGGMMSTGGGMMSTGGGMMSTGGGMMSTGGGMMSTMGGGMLGSIGDGMAGGMSSSSSIQQTMSLQAQCQEYLKKAEYALQSGGSMGDAERYMMMAKDTIEQLKMLAMDMRDMGQPPDNVIRTMEMCKDQLKGVHMAMTGSMNRRRSTRGSSGGWEEPGRSFQDAMAWIAQQKRLIETSSWGDDAAAINQQLNSHQNFHSSIQRSAEVDRAKDDLVKKGDKGNLHALDQEWDTLQKMSFGRTEQLQELKQIIQDMSKEIMWVNDREEEELMFDWGDKNIDQYIPRKQESYSKLMSALEDKEKDLNKLKSRVDALLKSNHPASDKIEAYKDTLQTQWSWLLQITKCIDVHLKENAAYSQFFKEANETYSSLQKEHETVRRKFTCDKNTSLENLMELLRGLEREKEKIMENKRQVQHLVNKSKSIVRLKPRNPEEKSSSPVFVKALCDFKQDQKVICKENKAILKDNSQRSKWDVTGPGGLDMLVPSVCLIVPPPNPLGISLANKNEQYYEAIMSIWNQLYINVKSLISWQYCLLDIKKINSLTVSMLSRMRPEEYRQLIKSLETHYEEFKLNSHGSQMFADEDKRSIENQFTGAQTHYEQIVVQLPTYIVSQGNIEAQQAAAQQAAAQQAAAQQAAAQQAAAQQAAAQQAAEARRLEEEARMRQEEAWRLEEEARMREEETRRQQEEARRLEEEKRRAEVKKVRKSELKVESKVVKKQKAPPLSASHVTSSSTSTSSSSSSRSLSELHALRLKLEGAENTLSQHVHICLGDDGMHDCGLKISQLETLQQDVESLRAEYLRLRGGISMELEGMNDSDKAQFLRSEIGAIDLRLGSLESSSSAYVQRLQALRDMLESVARAEDIVKVHEARLTEKETTSLSHSEVGDYMLALKNIKAELDQKKDVLASMEAELAKASHWNSQVGGPFHRCDMMLSKYTEQVNLLSDRWRRIQGQIDTRVQDLQLYQPQLQHYKQTSTSLIDWIDVTKKKQDALQATKIESIQGLTDHINNQKALNSEILGRRETVESVLKDNETCVNAIKDYETDLASYTSGLETLLNIPIKRTMLKSPSMDLNLEATQLQTRYMELLTHSGDYYKFLGELLKNMEELKIRNTRIDLLEEELRLLRENMQDRNAKNKSLEDAVSRYRLELSNSQDMLLSMEEVKQTSALQCNATKDSLDSTQSQLADLNDEVTRLKYLLEEEKRKKRLAEDRYTTQQEEYELVLRRRQNELDTVSRSKTELEKSVSSKDHEIVMLQRQLAEEAARFKELQREMSKVRSQFSTEINNLKLSYESQIHVSHSDIQRLASQREEDTADLQMQKDRMEAERRNLEEEVRRLRMSMSLAEEQRMRAEEEAHSQRAVITEEGRRRREVESQVEVLLRQIDEESSQYTEELAQVMKSLQDKSEELAYITHSLEEETRRRRTIEEGQSVLEQTLAQLQVKLTSSSVVTTQLGECEEELQKMRLELERESRERSRVEQNMSRLQGRMKDLQSVRDELESQVDSLKKANQEEVSRRRQVETELKNTTMAMTDYISTITTLRQSQEHANMSEKRAEEEHLRLQEELEKSSRQNKTSAEHINQLSAELKALQQQFLQEQAKCKEANLRNKGLYRTIEEKSKALNENSVELQRLKEMTETQTKERLRLEEELRATQHDKEELLRSKQGKDDELSSHISGLELQLQASERSNVDYRNLVSELSSERQKLKLETEKIQKQVTETTASTLSIQSQYSEIVNERDALLLKLKLSDKDKDRYLRLEEELSRIKLSQDSELRNKQRLQEENERVKRDLDYWKEQYESKQGQIRQYDTDKERLESEKNTLKSEIERLMRELRELDETYKSRLSTMQKELREVAIVRKTEETELMRVREPPTLDASTLIFDGVRKPVTANQLLDCGVLDKPTFTQLAKGHKTVPDVSNDKKVSLKGTGPIAGVVIGGLKGPGSITQPIFKMTFTEAKKENLLPPDSVDLLLDAQAATGHIIDPRTNQKLTVKEACDQGVVDEDDKERLLAAEAAAVGYRDPGTSKPLSVFQAMKKGLIDKNTTLRLLQAQESVGGILDPVLSVFLPKDTAIDRNLINNEIYSALNRSPELYLDPESEDGVTYISMKRRCKVELQTGLLLLPISEKVDPSKLVFDGVRKPVTAKQLLDCGVLDKPTFIDLEKGKQNVPEVSVDKNVNLKGTGPIAGVVAGSQGKLSFSEAKKQMLLPEDSADLLLEAQAATGHIINPRNNQKLTVEDACARGVVDISDRDRLLAAEAAAVGYKDSSSGKPFSVFEAMKKGVIDRKTGLRLLQAQESVGGILDPNLSVFLPKDTAIKRNLLDENLRHALNQSPECYRDPETERDASYDTLKKRCKTEPHTGLLLLPITEKLDPSKLIFDGVRKQVTAKQLLDCGVLDKATFNQLMKGEKTVPEVSVDNKVFLKGTGSIAGVAAGPSGKMSLSEAKKQMLMPPESADLLLDAQAATGHIIDPTTNQKLTVEEACARRVVDNRDRDRLLTAEAAAVGYRDPSTDKPLSVFEAIKKGLIDRNTGLRLLQAQESAGGILDPNLSVFLPIDTAIKRNLLDENLRHALNQSPECYRDPETERDASYDALKKRCKTEPHTGLLLLPITEKLDPSKLIFDGVRKQVTAKQLLDCGVLDKATFNQLMKGEKTVPEVSVDNKVFLKGTGSIAGVAAGPSGKMSLSEAKKQMLMPPESADLLLDAQAATGHIIDPTTNQKLTVEEACAKRVVDNRDRDRLLAAEAAAVGYWDPSTATPLSVFEAIKKGLIDRKTGLRLLQAQESAGGILDPNLSVFLPKDTAIKRNLLDDDLCRALNQSPTCYIDPNTEHETSYGTLKKRSKTESHTGLILLPIKERKDPSKLMFDGIRKSVSAQQLFECGVIDKPTLDQLVKGEKTVSAVSMEKTVYLKGTGAIGGVLAGREGKMSFSEAKKQLLLPSDSAYLLLEAQAATGYIIDPETIQQLTVEEACARGVVDIRDRDRLLAAEAAAVGFKDPSSAKLLSVFEAMEKGLIDRKTGLRLLQAQESVGGIIDPNLSVFLPKDTAIKRNLLDENLRHALNQSPECYRDPETESGASYGTLQERCKTESQATLQLLPITEKFDPSKLVFDGVRKTVTAQQLLDCGVLNKATFNQLLKGEKTVSEVSVDIKVFLMGTGSIAGVTAGPFGKMSFTEAKKQKMMSSDSADMLLEAQAATGNIIDPKTNQKMTVKEACARGVVDKEDESKLYAAEAAIIGYRDPNTGKLLSAGQAMKKGLIDKDTALRILQAQESVGGILDPALSIFLPKDIAMNRDLIDEDLYQSLNQYPACYLDPDTQQATTYVYLKKKCKVDPKTGLLLLPEPKKPLTVQGLRDQVSVIDLVDANLLSRSVMDQLREGRLTSRDIEDRLCSYLRGSTCIAGVYDEASDNVMPIYQAMKDGLLKPENTLELLEAQAASGFIIDPVNNHYLTVSDAYNKRLFGPEFKDNLLAAEKAVTGYKLPGTDKVLSLFQAIKRGLVEKGHGMRLLEAQFASGGIVDPEHSHRIDVNEAYKRGYFDKEMNKILTDQNVDTQGFFDPNTEENLTYLELKKRCISDKKTGLILLPIKKDLESTLKNTLRKRRVVIVDPETNKEMTVREAYDKGYIDYDTFMELSEQECEWEEITITDPDGSTQFRIIDRKTGRQYDITELLEKRVIDQSDLDDYRSRTITLTQFADIIGKKSKYGSSSSTTSRSSTASGTTSVKSSSMISNTSASPGTSSVKSSSTLRTSAFSVPSSVTSLTSSVLSRPLSPTLAKMTTTRTTTVTEQSSSSSSVAQDSLDSLRGISSVSITLASPLEAVGDQEPVGAIFDTDTLEKITITEALDRDLMDSITAQRLLEAQACTGGIIDPTNGHRHSIQEATRLGIITADMASKLKPAQKAFFGFEDVKTRKKMSAAQAMKEMWLPYEAGQRFLEFQVVTGGLYDPEMGCRRSIEDAVNRGWLDARTGQKLQDVRNHTKNLTCPKTKLKISYKQALDNCLVEESNGLKMLQASSVSSRGISSPYNVSSAPGSTNGSRSGSRRNSRRSSVDLGSPNSSSSTSHYSRSFTTFSSSTN